MPSPLSTSAYSFQELSQIITGNIFAVELANNNNKILINFTLICLSMFTKIKIHFSVISVTVGRTIYFVVSAT